MHDLGDVTGSLHTLCTTCGLRARVQGWVVHRVSKFKGQNAVTCVMSSKKFTEASQLGLRMKLWVLGVH